MPDSARLAKAVHLTLEKRSDGAWRVSGGSEPHIVSADGSTCDCADARIRINVVCKHRLCVLIRLGDSDAITGLRELIPRQQRKPRRVAPPEHLEYEQPPEPVIPLGALSQWQLEVRNGERGQRADAPSTWIMDDLWRAAAYEATALEAERHGEHVAARDAMDRAIHILAESRNHDSVAA